MHGYSKIRVLGITLVLLSKGVALFNNFAALIHGINMIIPFISSLQDKQMNGNLVDFQQLV